MSNLLNRDTGDDICTRHPCRGIDLLLEPHIKDLGGFSVRRLLPSRDRQMVGPFIFFDHFGPADMPPGQGMDVRPHPHINLATITYLFDGEILHRDSLGTVQAIRPGAINLMTAGRGIVHSERTPDELRAQGHRLHGLQLWVALPEETEETEPAFGHYPANQLPTLELPGVSLRVMIGNAFGLSSPVQVCSPTLYAEARLEAGASLKLPSDVTERAVYLVSGTVLSGDRLIEPRTLAVLHPQAEITLNAREPSQLALVGGEPLGRRSMFWNFVSSRPERIEQAKQDWQAGQFPKVPGETEFIPLP